MEKEDLFQIQESDLDWYRLKDKVILITGANGFIASNLIRFLDFLNIDLSLNMKIIGTVRREEYFQNLESVEYVISDLINLESIKDKDINIIIHAASKSSPKFYRTCPVDVLNTNLVGTYNLLNFAKDINLDVFLFLSSLAVYGEIPDHMQPITEDQFGILDPTSVSACYSESKRMAETMCGSWFQQYRTPTRLARLSHCFGPGIKLDEGRVHCDFLNNVLNNENVVVRGHGKSKRVFIYISDLISGLMHILLKGKDNHAYNIANPETESTIKDFADIVVSLSGKNNIKTELKLEKCDALSFERCCPAVNKLKSLGWNCKVSLEDGLIKTLKSYG